MENFFYDDKFYRDIGELMEDMDFKEDLSNVEDDWAVNCVEAILEPLVEFTEDWIQDHINEERFPEDDDDVYRKMTTLFKDNINFDAIAAGMPKLYYPKRNGKFIISKFELQEYIS